MQPLGFAPRQGPAAGAFMAVAFLLLSSSASAQTILWSMDYGGTWQDGAYDVTETSDAGFIVTGFNSSQNSSHYQRLNLLRTDASGNTIWNRTYDGVLNVWGSEVLECPDGGFIIAGVYEVNSQTFDSYVLRTDASGSPIWQHWYDAGIGDDDRAHAICLTGDGGFILAGQAWVLEPPFGSYDMYAVKCNAAGTPEWSRFYRWETEGADVAMSVAQTADGGYLLGGFTQTSVWDAYVVRTDPLGDPIWQGTYGGTWADEAFDMRLTSDGGFVLAGAFVSNTTTDTDVGLVKADAGGNVEWERVYGGNSADWGQQVSQTGDGGYLVAGHTGSFGAGSWDGYVLRTDAAGTVLWTQTFGGSSDDRGFAVEQTNDGDVIVAGWAWSFGAGLGDAHLLKIDDGATVGIAEEGTAPGVPEKGPVLRILPNPFLESTALEFGLRGETPAVLRIFDAGGRKVRTLLNGRPGALEGKVIWNGTDAHGRPVAPGTYFGTLSAGGQTVSRKMILLPSSAR